MMGMGAAVLGWWDYLALRAGVILHRQPSNAANRSAAAVFDINVTTGRFDR